MDVDSAESAINAPESLKVQIPHVAITNRAFESTQVARIANAPLNDIELSELTKWQNGPDHEIHDRSIRLLLGLR